MKTKLIISIIVMINFATLCCCNSQTKLSDKQQLNEQIIDLLKTFYTSYITEVAEGPTNEKIADSLRQQYCTAALLRRIETLEYDPFIKAQDAKISALKTLTVEKDSQQLNWFIVSYIDTYGGTKIIIKLKFVNENGSSKIDSIK